MANGPFNNVAASQPDDDADLQIAPGPGVEQGGVLHQDDNFTITQEEDGSVTIDFSDPNVEEPVLGFGDNLAEKMDEAELAVIGSDLLTAIQNDDAGRNDWKNTYEKGLDLLGLKFEERNEPFEGASGVLHPVLNEAVVQFQANAYKELLPAGGPCRTVVAGDDSTEREQQAERVRDYMNYLITEEMEEYDPDFDQMLWYVGFGGSAFKKVYYDTELERSVSPYILPKDLIVPYDARDLFTAERVTHVVHTNENNVKKLQKSGFYRDVDIEATVTAPDSVQEKEDKIRGVEKTGESESVVLYECHCNLSIPGEHDDSDIQCPYIVTLDSVSGTILSIRRNYREKDKKKRKKQYFVHYKFLPGPGFYGLGLVHLLGNVAQSSTSTLRQLIDAGTLSNLPGGFKAKGMRVANEKEPIQPGEWRDVDAPGGDLQASLMPLPYKEPSNTLFQLLGFLVESAEKFIGTTDLGMGDSNQELPVGSVIALLERGSRMVSSVHKRLHYAQKQELKLLAKVVAEAMPDEYPYEIKGQPRSIKKQDFDDRVDVIPVSDPNIFSMTQRISLAQEQLKMAQAAPQIHNQYEAYHRMYLALQIPDIDDILPPPPVPAPESPMAEHAKFLAITGTSPVKAFLEQDHDTHLKLHLEFNKMPILMTMPPAQVALMQHIMEHVTFKAKQQVMQGLQQMAMQGHPQAGQVLQLAQQNPKWQDPQLQKLLAQAEARVMQQVMPQLMPPPQQGQDPLVALKQQELQIEQQNNQQRNQIASQQIQIAQQKLSQDAALAQQKLQSSEKVADSRNQVALMKQGQDANLAMTQLHADVQSQAADQQHEAQQAAIDRAHEQQQAAQQAQQAQMAQAADQQHQAQQNQMGMMNDAQQAQVDRMHQAQQAHVDRLHQANEADIARQAQAAEAEKNRKAAAKAKPKPAGGKKNGK